MLSAPLEAVKLLEAGESTPAPKLLLLPALPQLALRRCRGVGDVNGKSVEECPFEEVMSLAIASKQLIFLFLLRV